jgi:hypothetical protein
VMSFTVIICAQVAELPQTSVALYVLVTVNLLAQVCPLVTSLTKVIVATPPQLSDAVTEPIFAGGTKLAHETVTGPGQVIVGGVISFTVMICAQVALLPQMSVAR